MNNENASHRIGQRLLNAGVITEEQLEAGLERKRQVGGLLGEALVELGFVLPRVVGKMLEEVISVPYVDLTETPIEQQAVEQVNERYQRRQGVLPFRQEDRRLFVAMRDPLNVMLIDDMHMLTGMEIVPRLALQAEIQDAFNRVHSVTSITEDVLKEIESNEKDAAPELSVDQLVHLAEDAPIIRLVNSIIEGGINASASDIHIEPQGNRIRVRYRQDGILYDQMLLPPGHHAAVVSRIKIMSHLDIAERRRPQDGRFSCKDAAGKEFDLRVSIMPMIYGEKVVMRLLPKSSALIGLEQLGFAPEQLATYESFLHHPYGMILVTGPTGSGKSTTLYASLSRINDAGRNINTLEDPVEYTLPGINQAQVNSKIGVTFAAGLRSLLRQDPDVVMVGEIRDTETAEIAIQSSLTGHLVLATLHTNDAPGALVRLRNMGIEPFLVTSALVGVVGQRLLRRVCPACSEPDQPRPSLLRALKGASSLSLEGVRRRGAGCPQCAGRGFRGRTAAYEVMPVTETLSEAFLRNVGGSGLKRAAVAEGMLTMSESGMLKVQNGETTLDEVCRVLLGENINVEESPVKGADMTPIHLAA